MKFDTGTIITVVAVLLFYLRLIIIQRQRVKKAQYQYAQVSAKNSKKKKNVPAPEVRYSRLGVQIKNWWVVAGALALIVFGAAVAATQFLGSTFSTYWWIPVVLGVGIFAFDIK